MGVQKTAYSAHGLISDSGIQAQHRFKHMWSVHCGEVNGSKVSAFLSGSSRFVHQADSLGLWAHFDPDNNNKRARKLRERRMIRRDM